MTYSWSIQKQLPTLDEVKERMASLEREFMAENELSKGISLKRKMLEKRLGETYNLFIEVYKRER